MNQHEQMNILGTSKEYHKLEAEAQAIAKRAGVPFTMHGLTYDKKNGLTYGHEFGYLQRRECGTEVKGKWTRFVSVEKSEGYPGMKEGYYIIVGDICYEPKDV